MGRPLDIRIPVLGNDAAGLRAQCIRLLPSLSDGVETDHLPPASISLNGSGSRPAIILRTAREIHSPILQFRIRIDCSYGFERDYFLLPEPYAAPAADDAPALAVTQPVKPAADIQGTTPPDGDSLVLDEATTLRTIARQKYPHSSKRRVSFIRRMAAANPEVFPSRRGAADQPLEPGLRLNLPPKPQPAAAAPTAPAPKPVATVPAKPVPVPAPPAEAAPETPKPVAPPPAPAPKPPKPAEPKPASDRLVISPGGGDAKGSEKVSMADATQAMDRMSDLMNEQLKVQTEMSRQVAELHTQIEQLRTTLATVQTEKQAVERKLVEKESESGSMLQLILAIAAGGIGGAGVLSLLSRRRG